MRLEELESRRMPVAPANVVLVVTDDQRWDSMQYLPATQQFFEDGTIFDNAFVTTPIC